MDQLPSPDSSDSLIRQNRALVRAIEALSTIKPTSPFQRALVRLPMLAYNRRLCAIVGTAPAWVSNDPMLRVHCRGAI